MLIHRNALLAVLPACLKNDDSLYTHLSAVAVQPDGLAIATDGYVLITARSRTARTEADFPPVQGIPADAPGVEHNVYLRPEQITRLLMAMPSPRQRGASSILQHVRIVASAEGRAHAVATHQDPVIVTVPTAADPTVSFPRWHRVLPPPERPIRTVILGLPVLKAVIKAATAAGCTSLVLEIPTEPTHYTTDSVLTAAIRVTGHTSDVELVAVVAVSMPPVGIGAQRAQSGSSTSSSRTNSR